MHQCFAKLLSNLPQPKQLLDCGKGYNNGHGLKNNTFWLETGNKQQSPMSKSLTQPSTLTTSTQCFAVLSQCHITLHLPLQTRVIIHTTTTYTVNRSFQAFRYMTSVVDFHNLLKVLHVLMGPFHRLQPQCVDMRIRLFLYVLFDLEVFRGVSRSQSLDPLGVLDPQVG